MIARAFSMYGGILLCGYVCLRVCLCLVSGASGLGVSLRLRLSPRRECEQECDRGGSDGSEESCSGAAACIQYRCTYQGVAWHSHYILAQPAMLLPNGLWLFAARKAALQSCTLVTTTTVSLPRKLEREVASSSDASGTRKRLVAPDPAAAVARVALAASEQRQGRER